MPQLESRQSAEQASVIKLVARKKWLLFVALTCSILWFSGYLQREIQFFQGKPPAAMVDFRVYYVAGLVARQQDDKRLYAYHEVSDLSHSKKKSIVNPQLDFANPDSTFARLSESTFPSETEKPFAITQYLYPPFFSILISPLTHLPYQSAAHVWYILTFLFLGLSVFLTVRMINENFLIAVLAAGFILFLAEFAFPMQDLLLVGNVGVLILFFCTAGVYLQKNNRPTSSALLVTLAIFVKLTPVIIIPLMIMRRQWKWLTAFVGWSVLLFVISLWQLGWENHQEFITKIMPAMSNGIAEHNNRSLLSLFQFIEMRKIPTVEDIESGAVIITAGSTVPFKIFAGLILLGVLYYLWRVNKTSSELITELFLLLLLTLVVSPVSWRHGYVLAIAPLIFMWLHPLTQKWSVAELFILTAATVSIFSVLPDYALSVSNVFLFQMLMISVMPTGVLISMFLLFKILRHSGNALHNKIILQNPSENAAANN